MDPELKQALADMEGRIDKRFDAFDRHFEVLDRGFETLDRRFEVIDRRFEAIDRRFEAIDRRFEALEERMAERIESTETKLLTAFHDWARTHEIRSRGLSTLVIGFEERLTIIEDRLSKLERRPNGGGPHTTN